MGSQDIVAKVSATIHASAAKIWKALTDPAQIKEYMFGATVQTDWKEGSDITWKGEWEGKAYEDKGKILQVKEGEAIQYSHYSPLSGKPDEPENYHVVTITLHEGSGWTTVHLEQDNNTSEKEREHSEENWRVMLAGIKKLSES